MDLYSFMQKTARVPGFLKTFRRAATAIETDALRWHGTGARGLGGILQDGVIEPANRLALHGAGTYFSAHAPHPQYATAGALGVPTSRMVNPRHVMGPVVGGAHLSQGSVSLQPKDYVTLTEPSLAAKAEPLIRQGHYRRMSPEALDVGMMLHNGKINATQADALTRGSHLLGKLDNNKSESRAMVVMNRYSQLMQKAFPNGVNL